MAYVLVSKGNGSNRKSGFFFVCKLRARKRLDSKVIERSPKTVYEKKQGHPLFKDDLASLPYEENQ
jgi:hypothetical protein